MICYEKDGDVVSRVYFSLYTNYFPCVPSTVGNEAKLWI